MSALQGLEAPECGAVKKSNAASAIPVIKSDLSVWVEAPTSWINSNSRIHRMAKAKLTSEWRSAAAQALPPGLVQFEGPVRIEAHIYKPRRGRYDPNNLAPTSKACVDGFVDSGILVDDDWNHVIGPDHRHGGIGPAGVLFLFTQLPFITVLPQ